MFEQALMILGSVICFIFLSVQEHVVTLQKECQVEYVQYLDDESFLTGIDLTRRLQCSLFESVQSEVQ